MKNLILALILIVSFNVFAAPTDKDFQFIIDDQAQQYEAYIHFERVPEGDVPYISCYYRELGSSNAWVWLVGPSIYIDNNSASSLVESEFNRAINLINAQINATFTIDSGGTTTPVLTNMDRIEWLVQLGIKESNNVLSRI
jgi:hypothetical protein